MAILRSVGTRKSFQFITKLEETLLAKGNPNYSLFDAFLDEIIDKNIFTKLTLRKLIEEESHHANLKSHSFLVSRKQPSFSKLRSIKKAVTTVTSNASELLPKKDNLSTLPTMKSLNSGPSELPSLPLKISLDYNEDILEDTNSEAQPCSIERHIFFDEFDGKSPNLRFPDKTISELAVSSYTVSSDYLKDDSDNDSSMRRYEKDSDIDELDRPSSAHSLSRIKDRIHNKSKSGLKRGSSQPHLNWQIQQNTSKSKFAQQEADKIFNY